MEEFPDQKSPPEMVEWSVGEQQMETFAPVWCDTALAQHYNTQGNESNR